MIPILCFGILRNLTFFFRGVISQGERGVPGNNLHTQ